MQKNFTCKYKDSSRIVGKLTTKFSECHVCLLVSSSANQKIIVSQAASLVTMCRSLPVHNDFHCCKNWGPKLHILVRFCHCHPSLHLVNGWAPKVVLFWCDQGHNRIAQLLCMCDSLNEGGTICSLQAGRSMQFIIELLTNWDSKTR